MANQSAAFGEVVISTKNKDDLKDFVYLQFLSERGANYPITLADFYGYTRVDKEEIFNTLEKSIDYPCAFPCSYHTKMVFAFVVYLACGKVCRSCVDESVVYPV